MTTAQQVENILRLVPATRSSDVELLLTYMQRAGMELTPKQISKFRDLPTPETLTRIRRKLQEQGKYEATHQVNEARFNKFKEMKQVMPLPWGEG